MTKAILVSGAQPTGRLHIGNYLGALNNFVELQDSGEYSPYFFVADYHSLTQDFDPKSKRDEIRNVVRVYLKAGLDPEKSVIFVQSGVPAHAELAWILSCFTPYGELSRMTQFKEKSGKQRENINVGLFTYPVLMAADIILYDAKYVPVGEDQLQHLEFTREIVRRFNNRFGKTFVEPKPLMTSVPRLMSFDDPGSKMSKSSPGGCLFLDDSPEEIKKKIMSAVTDSENEIRYDKKKKPGLSNLLLIYSSLSNKSVKEIEKEFKGKGYGDFKKSLVETVSEALKPFREKEYSDNEIEEIIDKGNEKARLVADGKIREVRKKLGIEK